MDADCLPLEYTYQGAEDFSLRSYLLSEAESLGSKVVSEGRLSFSDVLSLQGECAGDCEEYGDDDED